MKLSNGRVIKVHSVPPFAIASVEEEQEDDFVYAWGFQDIDVPDDWEYPYGLTPREGILRKVDYVKYHVLAEKGDLLLADNYLYGRDVEQKPVIEYIPDSNARLVTLSGGGKYKIYPIPPLLMSELKGRDQNEAMDIMFAGVFRDVDYPDDWAYPQIMREFGVNPRAGHLRVLDYMFYEAIARAVDAEAINDVLYGEDERAKEVMRSIEAMFPTNSRGETLAAAASEGDAT